ncbi:MAG: peptidoglycan editing factor PgeF [Lachnospiraceae bacterium]|nr:peptidoglycan editing factor PgeF [Lachnospiraceae bacterium]
MMGYREEKLSCLERALGLTCPHAFSTRLGGVSKGIFATMNLGMNRGDDAAAVKVNWDIFLDAAGISRKEFVCGRQVHGNHVHVAGSSDLRPAYGEGELIEADGYVTNEKRVPLAIFTADCVPLLMEDSENGVVAAVHCGWRSTVSDIEGEAVSKMAELGAVPDRIRAALGPAIDGCCFEVGPEVKDAVEELLKEDCSDLYEERTGGKYLLNLRGVVKRRLIRLGLRSENIELVGGCTMCHPDKYWSHRVTHGERGSMASVIELP